MRRTAPLLLALTALGGCAIPDLGERPVPRAAADARLASAQAFADAPGAWPTEGWWRAFGDPALDALIAEGLADSPDIAIAEARVRAADALRRQADAALLPTFAAEAGAGVVQQSKAMGIPPQFVPDGVQDTGHVAARASFDLDLWGRNRAALAAATSEAEAARGDAAQARLVLTTGIAAAYADLAGYHAMRAAAAQSAAARGESARLVAQRVEAGLDDHGTLAAQEARSQAARAETSALDQAIALTRNRLAALVGAGPDRALAIAPPRLAEGAAAGWGIPANAGIDLVGRRPDLVAARLRAEAAARRIDVAHADFYPDINLSALVGLQALGLGNLFTGDARYGNAGAAISLPIFDNGAIAARYRGARAGYDEAVARYDQTLVGALREVADALAARAATQRQVAQLRAALAAADEAARLAGLRYRAGLANQLPELVAQDNAAALRRALAQAEAQALQHEIALVRALGGGFAAGPQGDGDGR